MDGTHEKNNLPVIFEVSEIALPSHVIKIDEANTFRITPIDLHNLNLSSDNQVLNQMGGLPGLSNLLHVNLKNGLEGDELMGLRKSHFGENKFPQKKPKSFMYYILECLKDSLVQMLFFCGIAAIMISIPIEGNKGIYDGVGIFMALFVIIAVSSISDFKQAKQFAILNEEDRNIKIEVTRRGRRCKIVIHDLLVGDVVHLSIGDRIPADGILIEGFSLGIDESSMTGECEIVFKNENFPFLIASSIVVDGFGKMMVTAVGEHTLWGKTINSIIEENNTPTPLQIRLANVASLMGKLGIAISLIIFFILTTKMWTVEIHHAGELKTESLEKILKIFTICLTLLVIAIPEGLPLAVTLALAFSVHKMMNDKALVRKLASCETMGSVTTICSDKTGTLTQNKMSVVKYWCNDVIQQPYSPQIPLQILEILHEAIALNTSGNVFVPVLGQAQFIGSPTEKAILKWGDSLELDFDSERSLSQIIHIQTFNSEKKFMGVLSRRKSNYHHRIHIKGAAEIVLSKCNTWVNDDGVVPLSMKKKAYLHELISKMGKEGLRTICFSYLDIGQDFNSKLNNEEIQNLFDFKEENMTLLAIVGIKDPCRPEVPISIDICQRAGIMVRMVTGDNLETAKAIAKDCGILSEDGIVLEAKVFRELSHDSQICALRNLKVLARASPSDKLLLVKLLKEMDEIVAVTGDGSNDAAALNHADVGLAMGQSGTEIAKESADIVIMDDDFSSIVKCIRWGRSILQNIQSFLQFQLTTSLVAIFLNFVTAITSGSPPLTAVQMLWINLIQDSLGAIALASEPPDDKLLEKKVSKKTKGLVTWQMIQNISTQVLYQSIVLLSIWSDGKSVDFFGKGHLTFNFFAFMGGLKEKGNDMVETSTLIFSTFVFIQIFNQINCRRLESLNVFQGIQNNINFIAIFIMEFILQFLVCQFMKKYFGTTNLSFAQWSVCVLVGLGSIPVAFISKLFYKAMVWVLPKEEVIYSKPKDVIDFSFSSNFSKFVGK